MSQTVVQGDHGEIVTVEVYDLGEAHITARAGDMTDNYAYFFLPPRALLRLAAVLVRAANDATDFQFRDPVTGSWRRQPDSKEIAKLKTALAAELIPDPE